MTDDHGYIDVDVHNAVPTIAALFPFLEERWVDYCTEHGVTSLAPNFYPPSVALSARPELRDLPQPPGGDPQVTSQHVFGESKAAMAVLNCLYAVQAIRNTDWAVAMASAVNGWQQDVWLDGDRRYRASLVLPIQDPESAVQELESRVAHGSFVQVLLPAFTDTPLGQRRYWPIYEAAARHGLPLAIHPFFGGVGPSTPAGWPAHHIEDYAAASLACQAQLLSLVSEGVFQRHPELRVVVLESGVTWLPPFLWRFDKNWKGLRREVPWLDRPPSEIVRDHFLFSTQPFDCAPAATAVLACIEQLGSVDGLLYASDYPHWHRYDCRETLLDHLSPSEREKVLFKNAERLYGTKVVAG